MFFLHFESNWSLSSFDFIDEEKQGLDILSYNVFVLYSFVKANVLTFLNIFCLKLKHNLLIYCDCV